METLYFMAKKHSDDRVNITQTVWWCFDVFGVLLENDQSRVGPLIGAHSLEQFNWRSISSRDFPGMGSIGEERKQVEKN